MITNEINNNAQLKTSYTFKDQQRIENFKQYRYTKIHYKNCCLMDSITKAKGMSTKRKQGVQSGYRGGKCGPD
jgi:hypothetical protein